MHHHGAGLRRITKDDKLVSALIEEYQTASVGEQDRAMLAYVDKLTRTPAAVTAVDVEALRRAGFSAAG